MKKSTVIWAVLLVVGGGSLIFRAATGRMEPLYGATGEETIPHFGIWLAAFFILSIFSFLYKDNPFYKVAEHAFVGVSAAYYMVIGFWSTLVPNLFAKLFPIFIKRHFLPGLDIDEALGEASETLISPVLFDYSQITAETARWYHVMNPTYLIPLVLGILLLWRLSPKGPWISRWALAFIVAYTAGVRLIGFLGPDLFGQVRSTIIPLIAYTGEGADRSFSIGQSLSNAVVVFGVLFALVYFFFSVEHRGIVGKVARVGTFVLMITFGAAFGYTVMGRIALLSGQFQFLLGDWLWILGTHPIAVAGG